VGCEGWTCFDERADATRDSDNNSKRGNEQRGRSVMHGEGQERTEVYDTRLDLVMGE